MPSPSSRSIGYQTPSLPSCMKASDVAGTRTLLKAADAGKERRGTRRQGGERRQGASERRMPAVPPAPPIAAAAPAIRAVGMDQRGTAIPAPDRAMSGIGLGVLAYMLFSAHDATIKFLVVDLPVWQILFIRSTMIVIGCLAIGRTRLIGQAMRSRLKTPLLVRGVLTLAAWLCY